MTFSESLLGGGGRAREEQVLLPLGAAPSGDALSTLSLRLAPLPLLAELKMATCTWLGEHTSRATSACIKVMPLSASSGKSIAVEVQDPAKTLRLPEAFTVLRPAVLQLQGGGVGGMRENTGEEWVSPQREQDSLLSGSAE